MSSESKVRKQIKFAVVMYGGGSLAIYINGVAQELLKLAQATSRPAGIFEGTTRIYRKIALLLSRLPATEKLNNEIRRLNRQLNDAQNDDEKARLTKDIAAKVEELQAALDAATQNDKTSVEFIIDVLTGSSAGGINAVFLAKALINGAQDMKDLQKLWLQQGDFAKLLNDRQSVADNSLNVPQEPASLLNSQRMYLELLKALDALDAQSNKKDACVKSPDVLDLFVTYTDFKGLPINLALSDKTVLERVHKRVFNFRYENGKGDFEKTNNPFLAFAARCTSSFPIAFEPMRLTNIDEIINLSLPEYEDRRSNCPDWMKFFNTLTDENGKPVDWTQRWFVDGGCLDNKPFGFAIDKLTQRTGEGIVERKLLYVEPNPESFRDIKNKDKQPNALENVFGQASGLPGYETIREDLKRVLDRNRLIERVARLTADVEGDFERNSKWLTDQTKKQVNWAKADLNDVAENKGAAFIPYYRLRVSSTTDEIARLVTRYFKIDEDSDYFNVLRFLIRFWRDRYYQEYAKKNEKVRTLNEFLYLYDVEYRLRRLRFVLQKIDYMLRHKDLILKKISAFKTKTEAQVENKPVEQIQNCREAATQIVENKTGVMSSEAALFVALPGDDEDEKRKLAADFNEANYVNAVFEAQSEFSRIYLQLKYEIGFLRENLSNPVVDRTKLSEAEKDLEKRVQSFQDELLKVQDELKRLEENQFGTSGSSAQISMAALNRILVNINFPKNEGDADSDQKNTDEVTKSKEEKIFNDAYPGQDVEPLVNALTYAAAALNKKILNPQDLFLRRASSEAKKWLGIKDPVSPKDKKAVENKTPEEPDNLSNESKFVRNYLKIYYELFDSYDQISYPLFFESPVGEAVKVDVVRVSSRDAHSLINEEKPDEKRRKLAGDYLFAFGAFLDPRWRLNDIMWGRLDGAERLITTLLPGEEFAAIRDALIKESNETILGELLLGASADSLRKTLVGALVLASSEPTESGAIDKLVLNLTTPAKRTDLSDALTTALSDSLKGATICDSVKADYEVNRRLEPQPTLKTISRSTQIIGKILQDITEEQINQGDRLNWILKLSQIFWGLVTVAAPNSIWNLLFNYWIQLLYLFEIVVIAGATISAKPDIQQFGIIALIVTLGIHLTVMALEEVLLGNTFWKTLLRFLIGGILAIFVIAGTLFFYSMFFDKEIWQGITRFHESINDPENRRWVSLLPFAPFAILFVLVALRREVDKLNLKIIGRALIAGFLAITALSFYFLNLTTGDYFSKEAPLIKLEFVRDGKALTDLVSGFGAHLDGVKTALWVDTIAFIPLYLGFLLILSAMLGRRRQKWANVAAIVAAICSATGALFDLVENYYSLQGLDLSKIDPTRTAGNILFAAETKWTLIFVAMGILSTIFFRSSWKNIWNAAGALLLLSAVLGIVGTFKYPIQLFGVPMVNTALIGNFLILLIVGISFQIAAVRQYFFRGY